MLFYCLIFLFKQKTAYEMRISDWSSDVCSSDLQRVDPVAQLADRSGLAVERDALREIARACGRDDFLGVVDRLLQGLVGAYLRGDIGRVLDDLERPTHLVADRVVRSLEIGRASCRERVCQSV